MVAAVADANEKPVQLEAEIDRLYGLPLDEFVAQRGALAKRLRGEGEREAAEQVKGLRKPTAGAWALNQAVRRRRSETEALLEAGERLRAAHEALVSGGGGGRAELRQAMEQERSLAGALADCAEAIASETGKSGPALRERVRTTLHAAALDPAVRDQLAAGRLVHEHEAVGLAAFGSEPAAPAKRAPKAGGRRGRSPAPAAPGRERPHGRERTSARERAAAERSAERERAAAAREEKARLAEAERQLREARSSHADAEAAGTRASQALEAAQAQLEEARVAERAARKQLRERKRELEARERELERLRR